MEELMARVRRCCARPPDTPPAKLPVPVTLDTRSGKVFVDGAQVKLTSHELPAALLPDAPYRRVVSRAELTEHLYDQDFDRDSNTIEVFVGRLRKKLAVDLILTVPCLGYLVDPNQPPRGCERGRTFLARCRRLHARRHQQGADAAPPGRAGRSRRPGAGLPLHHGHPTRSGGSPTAGRGRLVGVEDLCGGALRAPDADIDDTTCRSRSATAGGSRAARSSARARPLMQGAVFDDAPPPV